MTKKVDLLRELGPQELESKIVELRAELSKEKAQVASGMRAEKPAKIRNARRQIARILTILNEKARKQAAAGQKKLGAATAAREKGALGQTGVKK